MFVSLSARELPYNAHKTFFADIKLIPSPENDINLARIV